MNILVTLTLIRTPTTIRITPTLIIIITIIKKNSVSPEK